MALTDEAIVRIKDMIVRGELRPGDRLPREADLATKLGLSRNSLREAVRALSLVHILDVRQGDGTYVTSLEPELLLEALTFVIDFHQDDTVAQLLEVRRILEPAAAAMAATRVTQGDISELHSLLDQVSDTSSVEELVEADAKFHRRISQLSGNDYLATLIDSISAPTARARVWRGITEDGAAARTLLEHRAIVDALAAGAPDIVRSWATVHVTGVEDWVRRARHGVPAEDRQ